MNKSRLSFLTLLLCWAAFLGTMAASDVGSILKALDSDNRQQRLSAVRGLAQDCQSLGDSEALKIMLHALSHENDLVVQGGLHLAAQRLSKKTLSEAAAPDQENALKAILASLLHHGDRDISRAAADLLVRSFDDPTAEELLVDRLRIEPDTRRRRQLVRSIGRGSIATQAARQALLLEATRDEATLATVEAAETLALMENPPPPQILSILVELAGSERFFARPNSMRAIGAYGKSAQAYLGALRGIQDRLKAEIAQQKMALPIYNKELWKSALEDLIASLEEGSEGQH